MEGAHTIGSLFIVVLVASFLSCSDSPEGAETGVDANGISGGDVSTDGLFPPGDSSSFDGTDESTDGGNVDDVLVEDVLVEDTEVDTRPPSDSGAPDFPGRYEECGFGSPPCEDPLYCGSDGFCHEPSLAEETEGCDGEEVQCAEGLICFSVGFDGSGGRCQVDCSEDSEVCDDDEICIEQRDDAVCLEDCDPDTDPECDDPSYECRSRGGPGGGDPACYPTTGGVPGEQEFGEECDEGDNRCVDGLVCLNERIPGVYCTRECSSSNPCPSPSEGTVECIDIALANYCLFTCEGGTGCPEGMTCNDLFVAEVCSW